MGGSYAGVAAALAVLPDELDEELDDVSDFEGAGEEEEVVVADEVSDFDESDAEAPFLSAPAVASAEPERESLR
jgi:hypothetical protein